MSTRARLQPSIMPPAVLYLKNRLAAADRRYAGRFALLAAIHLAAFGVLLWSEDEPAAPADLGGAVARADRHSHRAVAVQARHPHDDGDLRRRDAHRRRHVLLLPKGQSRPGRKTRPRRRAGDAGDGPAVAGRAVPRAPRHRLARMPPLPYRARRAVVDGAD